MKDNINIKDFSKLNWFNNFTKNEVSIIESKFNNFPEDKFINLATLQFDLYEYNECDDYHFLVNKLINKVTNRYSDFYIDEFTCLKKNKIEIIVKGKKHKKAFRVNGSRFDIESLLDFLNKILSLNNIEEKFFLLDSKSDIIYPILILPSLLEQAKVNGIIATSY